ncbi:hypothetical protein LOZ80_05645 [Paenibacillus sp. HWE-109]|uniref:hypothetical protein n=1 Tax=Paenibacillus sp. HWE-109 TaxID=1306526 RepID=UPI001EDDC49A|nr:hypothetical protein [Paenibacillus sp. HWE-109]UKS28419.1 hypothetical protein LOZ80_05645 [Paenibacillus sp. HWE-109]
MDSIELLHTIARKYCMVKSKFWSRKYSRLINGGKDRLADGDYSHEAKKLFPRYIVLNAILPEVERYEPKHFSTIEDAKNTILYVIHNAQSLLTQNEEDIVCQRTMKEERVAFSTYVDNLCVEVLGGLRHVKALFYRRTLSTKEKSAVWRDLKNNWGIDDYWYPLSDSKPADVEAFMEDYFESEVGYPVLREILKKHNIEKVFELREFSSSPEYEIDVNNFRPTYNINGEGYWCSKEMDWVVYASHENSITIGGDWLIKEIRKVWLNWEERCWLDWKERIKRGI